MGVNSAAFLPRAQFDYCIVISKIFYKRYLDETFDLNCQRKFMPQFMRGEIEDSDATTWLKTVSYSENKRFAPS